MRGEADPALQAVFLRERRSLALVWIRDVRRAVADIMRFHREIVRHKADLRPGMEMKLIWQYGTFQVMCGVLEFLFRWWDPSRAVAWVGSVRGGLGRVMDSYGEILAAFDPSTLDVLQMDWVRRSSKS